MGLGLVLVGLGLLVWMRWFRTAPTTNDIGNIGSNETFTQLVSPAFGPHETIPKEFTCDGENISPPLRLTPVPPAVKYFAVVVEDLDADRGYDHWLAWDIPSRPTEWPAGLSTGIQGRNSAGQNGYTGPCPEGATHQYRFRVYGYKSPIGLSPTAKKSEVLAGLSGAITRSELVASYGR